MLASFRPGLLVCAALTASYMVPAQAGPTAEPLLPATDASLPTLAIPELIAPQGQPTLAQPDADEAQPQINQEGDSAEAPPAIPAVKPTGDLSSMVAQLRAPD